MMKRVTHGKLTAVYDVPDTFDGELNALDQFEKQFAAQLPQYRPGTSATAYYNRFKVTNEGKRS